MLKEVEHVRLVNAHQSEIEELTVKYRDARRSEVMETDMVSKCSLERDCGAYR
jgi:hypothetical protein